MEAESLREAHEQAVALLRRNLTPEGILAATPSPRSEARRYTRIFGRDAAICSLGMVASGEADLIEAARRGLLTLARHQAANGQIPKYVDPEGREPDFWYVGCIDATLWWLIAAFDFRHDTAFQLATRDAQRRALRWLRCQEHPQLHLLQQNEASDWADIMPRSGFVLYTNALWYRVKCLYGLADAEATKFHFNHLFYPFSRTRPDYRRLRLLTDYVLDGATDDGLYLSFVNFSFWGGEGDVFGNVLAVLCGLADEGPGWRIMETLVAQAVERPWPVRAVCRPIARDDPLWRAYMDRHEQNRPWQYHNGGCWPFIGAFWATLLASRGFTEDAHAVLAQVIAANHEDDWRFTEWFHGGSGAPMGMAGQSWNAAVQLLAEAAIGGREPFTPLP